MLDFESSPSSQNTAQKKGSRIGEVLPYALSNVSEAVNVLSPTCQSVEHTWLGAKRKDKLPQPFVNKFDLGGNVLVRTLLRGEQLKIVRYLTKVNNSVRFEGNLPFFP